MTVLGIAEASRLQYNQILFTPMVVIALSTYALCPVWTLAVLLSGRPLTHDHKRLIVVTIVFECVQTFAMLPLVQ